MPSATPRCSSAEAAAFALSIPLTGMPELVAILHSFVGLAAVLVGVSSYLAPGGHGETSPESLLVENNAAAWIARQWIPMETAFQRASLPVPPPSSPAWGVS